MSNAQQSMLNDEDLKDFGLLLIQEPHCFLSDDKRPIASPMYHAYWTQFLPSEHATDRYPIRSLIWVHKDIHARQIPVASPDLTAVLIKIQERTILAISVYIPPIGPAARQDLTLRIELIKSTINSATAQYTKEIELIIAGDFNRHDQLWGGDEVATTARQGEALDAIELLHEFDLQSLLPRGTATFESHQGDSTIDLCLTTARLYEDRVCCRPYSSEYGSDHRAIETVFSIGIVEEDTEPRLVFKNAQWESVRRTVAESLRYKPLGPCEDVDIFSHKLLEVVTRAIRKHVPMAKPSPYAKRWWTTDLTQLRRSYTHWRNRARAIKRAGVYIPEILRQCAEAKRTFFKTVRQQKKHHWTEFLQDTANIWQAGRYLDPLTNTGFTRIPNLTCQDRRVETNEEIAAQLLEDFFPPLPPLQAITETRPCENQLLLHPLTLEDVRKAIFSAKPLKAAGVDGLPAIVWQQLWPVLEKHIFSLFQKSLECGKVPQQWKIAKIIPLRKTDKPDYSMASAYRPISLLSTLSKALEAVVAGRISFLVEEYSLLPKNHFGARKRQSTTHALLVLQERIFEAWRKRRVLSLISFDVKGAYNGVSKEVLLSRLRDRKVPEQLIRWIDHFCSDRKASIMVNGQVSATKDLPQAGLPQGSPLSPILFLFFNADLVQTTINTYQGAIAFVDDYSAWVTGDSAAENTRKIQETIIPRASYWESTSGALFQPEKTAFIHFTRNNSKLSNNVIRMKGSEIQPMEHVKILGVIFDQQLRYRQHAGRVAKRGLRAVLGLQRLRGLRPEAARQLYLAMVAPVTDYASPIWSPAATDKILKLLKPIQRIATQAITGAFQTVALPIAEAEASVSPTQLRLKDQRLKFWTNLHTMPRSHPFWPLKRIISRPTRRFSSPLMVIDTEFCEIKVADMETIKPYCTPPWQAGATINIEDRDTAIKFATAPAPYYERRIFTDGSIRDGLAGIGVTASLVMNGQKTTLINVARVVGQQKFLNAYFTELAAILEAIKVADSKWSRNSVHFVRRIIVLTDCQSALKSLALPGRQSGQYLIREILDILQKFTMEGGPVVSFYWVPSQTGIPGNEQAHKLARMATKQTVQIPKTVQLRSAARRNANTVQSNACKGLFAETSTIGQFTRRLDKALPGRHTKMLYGKLTRENAGILSQLRTGKCRLNAYLYSIQASDTDLCGCGQRETIRHLLFDCPRWQTERTELMTQAGARWGDISYLLGGWTNERLDGRVQTWKPDTEAVRATITFAKKTGRLRMNQD
jgi:ribonuclease HI